MNLCLTILSTAFIFASIHGSTEPLPSCRIGKTYHGVILKGGVNAGKYKEGRDFEKEEECSGQCCNDTQCDVAFMLGNKCFLVACTNASTCGMQLAKPSSLVPRLNFISRWNSEGVRRSLFTEDQSPPWSPNICAKMVPLPKVTLKGGISAGEFTDIGPVNSLQDCYDICCQQDSCNVAFILANNCFTVSCRGNQSNFYSQHNDCEFEAAVDSPFNPEAARVLSRSNPVSSASSELETWNDKPGNVENSMMNFPYFQNTFNSFPTLNEKDFQMPPPQFTPLTTNSLYYMGQIEPPQSFQPQFTFNDQWYKMNSNSLYNPDKLSTSQEHTSPKPKDIMIGYITIDPSKLNDYDLFMTSPPIPPTRVHRISNDESDCKFDKPLKNSTFKHGKDAGVFSPPLSNVKNIDDCATECCYSKNSSFTCHAAFLVGQSCYLVQCHNDTMCLPTESLSSKYSPQLMYIRKPVDKSPVPIIVTEVVTIPKPPERKTTTMAMEQEPKVGTPDGGTTVRTITEKPFINNDTSSENCHPQEIIRNMTLEGVSKEQDSSMMFGSRKEYRQLLGDNVKDMSECSKLCCLKQKCDAIVLQDKQCFSLSCSENPRACVPVMVKSSTKETQLAFMARNEEIFPSKLGFLNKRNAILLISFSSTLILVVTLTGTAIVIVNRRGRKNKKPQMKKRNYRGIKHQLNKESVNPKFDQEEEEDKLEELLARASFAKNKHRRGS